VGKRIVYILVNSDYGGATQHVFDLIDFFSSGNDVTLIAPKTNVRCDLSNNYKHLDIAKSKVTISNINTIKNSVVGADIVHIHGRGALANMVCSGRIKADKILYTPHGIHESKGVKRAFERLLYNKAASIIDKIIFVSNSEKKVFNENISNHFNSVVIYNGLRDQCGIYEKKKKVGNKVLTVSRFHYQKNIARIIDIAVLNPDYEFDIVGDGPDYQTIERQLNDQGVKNVVLHGYQSDVKKFYENASIYLSTSRWEGLPLAVIDALRYRLPVILTKVAGHCEMIDSNNINGIFFDENKDVRFLLKKILNKYSYYSCNSRAMYELNFTYNKMIEQYKNIYSA